MRDSEAIAWTKARPFAALSDVELAQVLTETRVRDGDGTPVATFGVVDEAIRRRMGAWRLFDLEFEHEAVAPYRRMARQIVEEVYRGSRGRNGGSHRGEADSVLGEMGLSDRDRLIVRTLATVTERLRSRDPWNIELPASFYEAVEESPMADALAFAATDEQVLAGLHMWRGGVVEMNAGEGKTIAAVFPAVRHAVEGRRVHVVTANDYLALRDAEHLAPVYESLGVTVGVVLQHMNDDERRSAYAADVVYGTVRELGFDFLRDNMRHSDWERVQRGLDVAIVDEADQVLIDESPTPLIISGSRSASRRAVHTADAVVREMAALQGCIVDRLERTAQRLPAGGERRGVLAALFLADPENEYVTHLAAQDPGLARRIRSNAADAIEFGDSPHVDELYYRLDADNGSVIPTERGHRFVESRLGPTFDTSGLEAARERVRADAGPDIAGRRRVEERLDRRISRNRALSSQVQQAMRAHLLLRRGVDYVVAEGHVVLVDQLTGRRRPDTTYRNGLHTALEAKEGLPVNPERQTAAQVSVQGFLRQYAHLSGMTGTALSSRDELRRMYGLDVARVPTTLSSRRVDMEPFVFGTAAEKLRAMVDEVESCVRAGRPVLVGTQTVEQSEAVSGALRDRGIPHRTLNAVNSADEGAIVKAAGRPGAVTVATNMAGRGTDIVPDPGTGLHVIGTELNPSRRVDDQLRGRAGRQGQAGTTRFMVSLEDRPLAGRALGAGLRGRGRAHDQSSGPLPIEDRKLERVQDLSTLDDEAQRAFLSDYHRVLDGQTLAYYSRRRETPASDAMYEECILAARGLAGRAVERWFGMVLVTDYDRRFDEMAAEMYLDFGLDCEELWGLGLDALTQRLGDLVAGRLDEARSEMGAARFDMLARTVLVQTSDDLWCGHIERLHEMMAVAPLAPADHKSAVAAFQRDCAEEYEGFVQDTLDSLIPRLLAAADAETVQNDPEPCVELPAELSGILV